MKCIYQYIFVLCIIFFGTTSFAVDNHEIDYLLSYLAESGCTFVRNGDEHGAKEASDHLEMKYNYAKKRIKTADDFIDKIASKSSMSRKPYEVHCGDLKRPAKQWLRAALVAHREAKKRT